MCPGFVVLYVRGLYVHFANLAGIVMVGKRVLDITAQYKDSYYGLDRLPIVVMGDRAFKTIPKSPTELCEVTQFKRELEVCELLALEGHPNIVKIYDIHDWGDVMSIEMEALTPLSDEAVYFDDGYSERWMATMTGVTGHDSWESFSEDQLSRRCWYTDTPADQLQLGLAKFKVLYGQAQRAINYMASIGFSHYDLHGSNWMKNKNGTLKMIDFDRCSLV